MKINESVYEKLTPQQRVQAAVSALARGDDTEIDRLRRTCPKKTYIQTDARFSDTMDRLLIFGLALSHDLLTTAMDATAWRDDAESFRHGLQRLANVEAVGRLVFERCGIVEDTDRAALMPPQHPMVTLMLEAAPPPDLEAVERMTDEVSSICGAIVVGS